ncbi:hypothetical protein HYPSUDRAFT_54001 [Hypholoma sublateritium FD-334 SS-4]|uniref:Uncharacterized protein n=1 Tax=Hypholoma sublateritium (strain FD-334 SS-4) TaxID=945553 RepID=A0A0D2MKB1_HYPSF|nr:hypothetical protein HYPSUDRAFT_54001 [Hypholoma sublateritium FD-334 SS-4]
MAYKTSEPPHAFASIRTWAASVAPGSPAPLSPRRRPSVSSTASRRRSRRPSLVVLTRAPAADAAVDLTALGYTSVFVHLPTTPTTPSPLLRAYDQKHRRPRIPPPPPPAPSKRSGMRRFRSLSVLRPRAKQPDAPAGAPPSPSKTTASAKPGKKQKDKPTPTPAPLSATTAHSAAEICAATVLKRKRAKYAYVRPPPTLAQELAVMQFADGGSMEANVRRAMERQATLAAGAGAPVGVADVYRDGAGGIWWDADEELEYAHLLAGAPAAGPVPAPAWEAFEPALAAPLDASRRTSLSSCDSDMDPARLLQLPEHEDRAHALPDDRVLASRRIGGPALGPVLCLPARPRRPAPHLARAHYAADVDMAAAFGRSGAENAQPTMPPAGPRARGKARRRPPPLTLAPLSRQSSSKRRRSRAGIPAPAPPPAAELPAPPHAAHARHEFLADSFAPPPAATAPSRTPLAPLCIARVPPLAPPSASMLHIARRGVRGLFTRRQAA